MTKNRHLVVAYNFPPFVDASAVTQAKRIAVAGRSVDVISQDMHGLRPKDDQLLRLVAPYIDVHDIISGKPTFVGWPSMRDFALDGYSRLIARGPIERYETVYSRSMWPHSHILGALVKALHPQIRWTAEFSDPLLHQVDGSHRPSPALPQPDSLLSRLIGCMPPGYRAFLDAGGEMLHLIQALPFSLADALVFTNEQQKTVMMGDIGDSRLQASAASRSVISPHPVPPADWLPDVASGETSSGVVRIAYFGTLYPNRGLGAISEAIRSLPPHIRIQMHLDVFTAQQEASKEYATRCGVDDVVRIHGELPYLEFLRTAQGYDFLLVSDTRTGGFEVTNPFLPSKTSDYLATGSEIFAITVPGSELDRRGYSTSATVDDIASIRAALIAIVEKRRPSGWDGAASG